jgi:hypothetical protein
MLPIVVAAPATANDRRDKWLDLLSFGIVVLPVSSMVPGLRARTFWLQIASLSRLGWQELLISTGGRVVTRLD